MSFINGLSGLATGLTGLGAVGAQDEQNRLQAASLMNGAAPTAAPTAAPASPISVTPPATTLPPDVQAAIARGSNPIQKLPKDQALAAIVQRESGGQNIPTAILGPDGKPASTASGYYQMLDGTWQEAAALAGIKDAPARAMLASKAQQDAAASALWDKYGYKPWAQTSASGGTG